MKSYRRGSWRSAFTLIELLVVISIIALLVGLLLPSLAGARIVSWTAMGLSNMKGLTQATHVYAADNADALMAPLSSVRNDGNGYTPGQFFTDMVGNSATEYLTSPGGFYGPRPGKKYIYADVLMDNSYIMDPALFSDPGKVVKIPNGTSDTPGNGLRSYDVGRRGVRAVRGNDPVTGSTATNIETTGYGCAYWPSSIWQTESYGGSVNTTQYGYWDKGGTTGSGWTTGLIKYPKLGNRPYPSENMWLMDYNGTNQPQWVQMLGSYNYAPFRNGATVHTAGTTAAVYFDGHAGTVRNIDIYPYRLKASGADGGTPVGVAGILSANIGMMVTPWDTGSGLSYWPNPANFPNFVGAKFFDSRNIVPLGGVNNFSGVDAQNVALGRVTP